MESLLLHQLLVSEMKLVSEANNKFYLYLFWILYYDVLCLL